MDRIVGSYTLIAFEIEDIERQRRDWGKDVSGLLIYTESGHVAVAINKSVENDPTQNDAENVFDSVLSYAGTYSVVKNQIRHQVTNASNPARIGKEMLRYAEWQGDVLTLTTPQEAFGRAILIWKKVGPA